MAQAVRNDKAELDSFLSQAKEKALLQKGNLHGLKGHGLVQANGNNQKGQGLVQAGGNNQTANKAYLRADELTYANRSSWKFSQGRAELNDSKVLQVDGEYSTEKLEVGTYSVYFEVMLTNEFNITSPVQLTLTRPDGSVQTDKQDLMNKDRNKRIWLEAGTFFNRDAVGNINFTLSGTETTTSKKGLVIYGVLIC